jgi:general stress protein CsbA
MKLSRFFIIFFHNLIVNRFVHSKVAHFLANAPLPKSPYSNTKMTIYFDTINLVWNYMVVNELKSPCQE